MVSLDQLAHDPSSASLVPRSERQTLIVQCASIIAALACTSTESITNPLLLPAPPKGEAEALLTIAEVANMLRFTRGYTYELVRRGEIRGMHKGKYWRVRKSEIEKFVAKNERIAT
jgi:excisionase family DNA binding protein